MYEKLPQELKDYPYFCGWKYETRNGSRTKVPKSVKGHNADNSNLNDFCGFDEIVSHMDKYDGIGIAIASDMAAIDINHCIEDGVLSDMASEIIEKVNTYTEISPSGTGIRLIGKTHGFTYDKEKYYINNLGIFYIDIYTVYKKDIKRYLSRVGAGRRSATNIGKGSPDAVKAEEICGKERCGYERKSGRMVFYSRYCESGLANFCLRPCRTGLSDDLGIRLGFLSADDHYADPADSIRRDRRGGGVCAVLPAAERDDVAWIDV